MNFRNLYAKILHLFSKIQYFSRNFRFLHNFHFFAKFSHFFALFFAKCLHYFFAKFLHFLFHEHFVFFHEPDWSEISRKKATKCQNEDTLLANQWNSELSWWGLMARTERSERSYLMKSRLISRVFLYRQSSPVISTMSFSWIARWEA